MGDATGHLSESEQSLVLEDCILRETQVVVRHALRGGLMPVISYTGPALAFLLTGTVVVERIFALPGLGNYFIQASLNRDEPLIIGIVAFISKVYNN